MKRKLDSGFAGKFTPRKIRQPVMGPPRFQGFNGVVIGFAHMFQALPQAGKRLLETALALVILILIVGLYLASAQRASDSARRQLSELGRDPAARTNVNQQSRK